MLKQDRADLTNKQRETLFSQWARPGLCLLNHNETEAINSSGQRSLRSAAQKARFLIDNSPTSFHKQRSRPQLDIRANAGLRPFVCVFSPGSCVHPFYTVLKPHSLTRMHVVSVAADPEWFFTVWNTSSSLVSSVLHSLLDQKLLSDIKQRVLSKVRRLASWYRH